MESRKMVLMNLFSGQQRRNRLREQICGPGRVRNEFIRKMEMKTFALCNVHICKIDSKWELPVWLRELKLVLCDNEEGWDGVGGRRDIQEGGDICIPVIHMIHTDVWPFMLKPTQYCKAIILQLKINKLKNATCVRIKIQNTLHGSEN